MKVIVIMHNNLFRLANIPDSLTPDGIRMNGKAYTTNGDYVHKEPWNHAYLIYYDKHDYSSDVKNLQNFVNQSKYNYDVYPMRGAIILIKRKHCRLLDCCRDDFKDILLYHTNTHCVVM
jgi:hypothetical protein